MQMPMVAILCFKAIRNHNLFFTVTAQTEIDAVKIWQKIQILLSTIISTIAWQIPSQI